MNVLFITLYDIRTISAHDIYSDLMREFVKNGHKVYIISPVERRHGVSSALQPDKGYPSTHVLKVKTGNIQKTNIIEKGISTILIEYQLKSAIKKYLSNVKFDLVLYSTPPITIVRPIEFIKKRDGARTYLLLKDIFPQNAVDLGMMREKGLKSFFYKHFRKKEKKLYAISDRIGCMSPANEGYVLMHNSEVDKSKVEECPNSIEVQDMRLSQEQKDAMRKKYGIPLDKKVFVYGGNLGKPQGIPFVIECLKKTTEIDDAFFLIVGDGTEYSKIESFTETENPPNVKLMKRLPKDDYDRMIAACDIGLIFLDHKFTIPNFPSRLLSYMQVGLPILAVTDTETDIGKVIVNGSFGWWCESNDVIGFSAAVQSIQKLDVKEMGNQGLRYLIDHYTVANTFKTIQKQLNF